MTTSLVQPEDRMGLAAKPWGREAAAGLAEGAWTALGLGVSSGIGNSRLF